MQPNVVVVKYEGIDIVCCFFDTSFHIINADMSGRMKKLIPDNLTYTDVEYLPIVKAILKRASRPIPGF